MIVEPGSCPKTSLLSTNHCQEKYLRKRFHMAVNKTSIKHNGHSSTNENRADDDYGGGGNENGNSAVCS